MPPNEPSYLSTPRAQPCHHVGEADPARIVEVQSEAEPRGGLPHRSHGRGDERRRRHAGGVAEAHSSQPELPEAVCDPAYPCGRDVALEGAAERGRDRAVHGYPCLLRHSGHHLEARERFFDAPVHVLPVVALRGGQEDDHLVDLGLGRAQRPALVRHQCGEHRPAGAVDAAHDLLGVGKLRHRARRHEGGRLDTRNAGVDEPVDELDLLRGRNEGPLGLEAVTRPDFGDLGMQWMIRHGTAPKWKRKTGDGRTAGRENRLGGAWAGALRRSRGESRHGFGRIACRFPSAFVPHGLKGFVVLPAMLPDRSAYRPARVRRCGAVMGFCHSRGWTSRSMLPCLEGVPLRGASRRITPQTGTAPRRPRRRRSRGLPDAIARPPSPPARHRVRRNRRSRSPRPG